MTKSKSKPQRILESLAYKASAYQFLVANPHPRQYRVFIEGVKAGTIDPEDMPENLKPGWLVKRLSPGERKVLAGLTSDMTMDVREDHAVLWIPA